MTAIALQARSVAGRLLAPLGPRHVAALVLAVHLVWVGVFFAAGHEIRDFARIGVNFVSQSTASDTIGFDPTYDYPENRDADRPGMGYDGQFYYYLALDPSEAHHYMDSDGYRYLRALYPMLARAAAGGDADLVPWMLLLLNLLAVPLGTYLLARWLVRRGHPAWPSLLYGLSPGLLIAVQRDLTEPLSYAFVAAAILALDLGGRRGWLLSAGFFALATLARQTTGVFVLVAAAVILARGEGTPRERVRRNLPAAMAFTALSLVPYVVYWALINSWLGETSGARNFTPFPFGGIGSGGFEFSRQGVSFVTVTIPAVIWMMAAWRLRRHPTAWPAAAAVLVNGLLFVVFSVDSGAFTARSRITLGVVLAMVLLLPAALELGRRHRRRLYLSIALWLGMLPVAAVYGLSSGTI